MAKVKRVRASALTKELTSELQVSSLNQSVRQAQLQRGAALTKQLTKELAEQLTKELTCAGKLEEPRADARYRRRRGGQAYFDWSKPLLRP